MDPVNRPSIRTVGAVLASTRPVATVAPGMTLERPTDRQRLCLGVEITPFQAEREADTVPALGPSATVNGSIHLQNSLGRMPVSKFGVNAVDTHG